jgi:hypothetical protein
MTSKGDPIASRNMHGRRHLKTSKANGLNPLLWAGIIPWCAKWDNLAEV